MARDMTPNQVVAWNLWQERKLRGWSDEDVTERLREYGVNWKKATYYAAEAARAEDATRRFSADEIIAFAIIFGRPVAWFLTPPSDHRLIVGNEGLDLRGLLALGLQRDLPDMRPLAERLREVATAIETFESERQPRSGAEQITDFLTSMGDENIPTPPQHAFDIGDQRKRREVANALREFLDREQRESLTERLNALVEPTAAGRLTGIVALWQALTGEEEVQQEADEERGTA